MGKTTGISWTTHTFNSHHGCTKCSEGCKNCYAETYSSRYGYDVWGKGKPRRTFGEKHWAEPLQWNRAAQQANIRSRVFCGSMMDWAEPDAPKSEIDKLWGLIHRTPFLDWLLLTKRADRIARCLPGDWSIQNYPNVWLGTSIESDKYSWRADELTTVEAVNHFISAEPLLGELKNLNLRHIEWLIVGGESGSGFRPMEKQWALDLMKRCEEKGIAFFYKQGSAFHPGHDDKIDGKEYKRFPLALIS